MNPFLAALAVWTAITAPIVAESSPVFYKDVLPILQKHCQACHRTGEIAPMPLTNFGEVRPWAKDIREKVTLRKMPPWFANPRFGHFANNPSLTPDEIRIIQSWVEAGSPEGATTEAPAPVHWEEGWNISPDIIFSMPEPFRIPSKATIDYQYLIIPTHFSMDRWVKAVEIRPSDRRVVHHAVLYVREPGSSWLRDVPPGVMYAPPATDTEALKRTRETKADILAIYSPGAPASTQACMERISSLLSEGLLANLPNCGLANHGGIFRSVTFSRMSFAQGRTSLNVVSGMGAISPARWHTWQCFCSMGRTSL